LVGELRYALGDVPDRRDDDHELDDFLGGDLAGGREELTTAWEREYGPGAPVWMPPTHSIEDDGYAHVLVDEAQDLSPMQWRMVGRRGRHASWTIVGDAAQSSWPYADEAAAARAEAIGDKDENFFRLSTNYRNSAEIFALAADLARTAIPGADLPSAVRRTGAEPRVSEVGPHEIAGAVRDAVDAIAEQVEGTIAVVVPADRATDVHTWLGP